MKRLLAIASLTARESIRSGTALSLLCLALAVVGWLALTLQGDGTLAGHAGIFLRYAAGSSVAILGLATLWLSAGRIASEVDDRTIQTLAVKPVRAAEVWAGKWLGLVLLNAALLAAVGCVVAAGALWILYRGGDYTPSQRNEARQRVLFCREAVPPLPDAATNACEPAANEHAEESGGAAHQNDRIGREVVPPNGSRTWTFDLPQTEPGALWVRFRFDYGSSERLPMQGTWSLHERGASNALWSAAVAGLPAGQHRLQARLPGPVRGKVALRFTAAPAPDAGVIVFRADSGAMVLVGEHPMPWHLLRALLIALMKLSVLAAAGLSCSALFSSPVATFAATSLAVATLCIQYFLSVPEAEAGAHNCGMHDHGGAAAGKSWYEAAAESVTRATARVLEPTLSLDGMGPVSDGLTVPWSLVGRAALVLLGGYVVILGALGVIALRRRELAGT